MAVALQSGQTSITGSVSVSSTTQVPTVGASQTHIAAAFSTTGSNQTVYTVTSGKTFYLFGFGGTDAAAFNTFVYKADGTTLIARSNPGASGSGQGSTTSPCPIAVYTSTQTVILKGDNSHTAAIWGVEQ